MGSMPHTDRHQARKGGGSLIGGGGGGDARQQCRPRRFFFINLIEYGVSFCILKYKFVLAKTMCMHAGDTR